MEKKLCANFPAFLVSLEFLGVHAFVPQECISQSNMLCFTCLVAPFFAFFMCLKTLLLLLYGPVLMIHNCIKDMLTISPPDATQTTATATSLEWTKNFPLLQTSLVPYPHLTSQQQGWSFQCFVHTHFPFRPLLFSRAFNFLACVYFPPCLFLQELAQAKLTQLL